MTSQPERRLFLELTQAATPILGRLRDEYGRAWTFSSWLGLLAALHAAVPSVAAPQTGDPRSGLSIRGASGADLLTTPRMVSDGDRA